MWEVSRGCLNQVLWVLAGREPGAKHSLRPQRLNPLLCTAGLTEIYFEELKWIVGRRGRASGRICPRRGLVGATFSPLIFREPQPACHMVSEAEGPVSWAGWETG